MSTRPWMPLYINDFRLDTLDLDNGEVGVYVVVLFLMWRRDDAALPNDMEWLKRTLKACFSEFHGHTFNRIVPKLLNRYFELGPDNKWRNKRLTHERQIADKFSAKQKQIANKRWSDIRRHNALAHASAMPSQSQSQRKKEGAPNGGASGKAERNVEIGEVLGTGKWKRRWNGSSWIEV